VVMTRSSALCTGCMTQHTKYQQRDSNVEEYSTVQYSTGTTGTVVYCRDGGL
jgi:hypothetical protein